MHKLVDFGYPWWLSYGHLAFAGLALLHEKKLNAPELNMRSMQSIEFGYPWWLSYGHLAVLGMAGALLALGTTLRWARWARVGLGVVALWSLAAFGVIHFHFNVNAKA